jgi:hypothetical protein
MIRPAIAALSAILAFGFCGTASEAEARGSDCTVIDVKVKPSGELGKALASMFNANGKASDALQQALTQACGR